MACSWISFVAIALQWSGTIAQQATWSIVYADTREPTPWSDAGVDICALDELHFRLDAIVAAPVLFMAQQQQQQPRSGSQMDQTGGEVYVPMEIVRVDHADIRASGYKVEHADEIKLTTTKQHTADEFDKTSQSLQHQQPHEQAPIECALDTAFCVPKIVGIRLPDVVDDTVTLSVNHTIVLQFAQPTNQPDASTQTDIERFVVFTTYIGDELEGAWRDATTLEIRVIALNETKMQPLQELMNALVHTTVRVPDSKQDPREDTAGLYSIQANVRLRVALLGDYIVRIVVGDELFESPLARTHDCGDTSATTVVVMDTTTSLRHLSLHTTQSVALPEPSVFIDGVLSHSGDEAFTLRHSLIKMHDPGSWSLNFWLFTNQDATGAFRTLFFHGDGTGQQRTPSAWLRPHDRRLVMRVSTVHEMDVGLDSGAELPLNEWVNIGFTFRNCSTGMDPNASVREDCRQPQDEGAPQTEAEKPWYYSMRLLVNGVLDEEVRIFAPALPNTGPLHVAKGPWTDGLSGFTSQLRVYGSALGDDVHGRLYNQGHRDLYRKFTGAPACESFIQRATAWPVTNQIAYVAQCVVERPAKDMTALATATSPNGGIYDESGRLLSECDASAWDLLSEAAELGDTRAQRDMGAALLFGRLPFPESCATSKIDSVHVPMDHSQARRLLIDAVRGGQWDAARYLALLQKLPRDRDYGGQHTHGGEALHRAQVGLYHLAAAAGRKEAFAILGRLYASNNNNDDDGRIDTIAPANADASAYHYLHAASDASIAYHARGKQPLHEMNRLYDGIDQEDTLRKGQLGDDDELIQYQKMRADKHHDVDAMANMGDLYYWGARGIARDHTQAYQYFQRAAERGQTSAQSAVAGMLLKGEGTKQDNASAIAWYEKAAHKNHTRALNGLGFMHFHGSGGMLENKTLALAFFERAAANLEDGDSVFNAGYCHAFGLGAGRNISRAIVFYDTAARTFGHFDAIYELGKIYWTGWEDGDSGHDGEGRVEKDSQRAIKYLKAASEAGSWGHSVRTGFELFLVGQFERAAVMYHEASEYGYAVATSNLAYLYDQKLLQSGAGMSSNDAVSTDKKQQQQRRALAYLHRAWASNRDKEVLVRIGDFHFYGMGGLVPNAANALRWYSRASAEGVEAGAYNVGHMHEYGLGGVPANYERAERYYRRVLELSPPQSYDKYVAVQLALARLQLRKWLDGSSLTRGLAIGRSLGQLPSETMGTGNSSDGSATFASSTVVPVVATLIAAAVPVGVWLLRRHQQRSSS